jgi:hypothetical protein
MKAAVGLLVRALSVLAVLALASPAFAGQVQNLSPAGLADGAGIWVNLWHWPDGDLDSYCSKLRANGIRNIFLQTSRSNTEAVPRPEKLGPIIEACHRHNIRVIAWSFSELDHPKVDAQKLIAAANFRSTLGHRLDGIAGNMEKNLAQERVEEYSVLLREKLGHNYPMIAVVYSPLNRAPAVAHIPWKTLAQHWDVIAPMTYWGGRYQKLDPYTYTQLTVQTVRKLTGRPDLEIHLIGDGMGTTSEQVQQFLKACGSSEVTSASLYPNHVPTGEQLACLGRYRDYFPSNSRFRLAAMRELCRTGSLAMPPKGDPSQPIARSEFYRLVARQLFRRNPSEDLSTVQAMEILDNAGVLPELFAPDAALEQALAQPVDSLEAISLVARSIEFQSSNQAHKHQPNHPKIAQKRRADRWLVQPASAEAAQPATAQVKLVNYLDASQLVLQARAGLR